jgi:hypothetical protein
MATTTPFIVSLADSASSREAYSMKAIPFSSCLRERLVRRDSREIQEIQERDSRERMLPALLRLGGHSTNLFLKYASTFNSRKDAGNTLSSIFGAVHLISIKFDGLESTFLFVLVSYLHHSITSLLKSAEPAMQILSSQLPYQDTISTENRVTIIFWGGGGGGSENEEFRSVRGDEGEGSTQRKKLHLITHAHAHT